MFGGGGVPGGFHSDVLSAEPSDANAVQRLTAEIKGRAVASVKAGNWPEAKALYSKAIEVNSTAFVSALPDNGNTLSILLANRSMCSLKMGANAVAAEDASAAIARDPQYLKAYYRKGVALLALSDSAGAREAFMQGLAIKPDDKELLEQLSKVGAAVAAKPSSTTTSSSPALASAASSTGTKKPASASAPVVAEEEGDGEAIRGYKIRADGTKTTFFNNDLSEEAKKLIGDIAPKKLDADAPLAGSAPATGSAWNSAGTFESVNASKWATARLAELLEAVSVSTPSGDGDVSVDSAAVTGDAEIVSNRGKTKRICDFNVAVKWTLNDKQGSSVKGSLEVSDVTADEDWEINDVKLEGSVAPGPLQTLFSQHVKAQSGCFYKAIVAALRLFCAEFKSKAP